MDRIRLISITICLIIYLLLFFPIQTIVTGIALVIAYFIIKNIPNFENRVPVLTKQIRTQSSDVSVLNRKNALKAASIYLAPYESIWHSLKLSNKFCSLKLGRNGTTITAKELTQPFRSFKVQRSRIHPNEELWNLYCLNFSFTTTFDDLIAESDKFKADINIIDIYNNALSNESTISDSENLSVEVNNSTKTLDTIQKIKLQENLTDINNASEVELTALPGVSIVLAKKLIKKREEIKGFKNTDDVLTFLKLRPHMEKQLRTLICVNKMKGSIQLKRYSERSIDL